MPHFTTRRRQADVAEDLLLVDERLWNCVRLLIRDPLRVCFPQQCRLRTATECCDATAKLRQLFSVESATWRIVCVGEQIWRVFTNHDKRCLRYASNLPATKIDVAQNLTVSMHRFQKKCIHPRKQMCFPHALVVARRFLSTQQLCLVATAFTVPVSETIDILHERSVLPESLVQTDDARWRPTGTQPRNWPRCATSRKQL